MKKRMTLMILFLVVFFGGLVAYNMFREHMTAKFFSNFQPPPVVISTTKVKKASWQDHIKAVGTLVAYNGVDISPQANGQIMKILFKSGQVVPKNKPLILLDARLDKADLANYEAKLALAKIDYERKSALLKSNAISKSGVDKALATLREAQAMVERTKVFIDYKTILAPFDGKMGLSQVNVGQYLKTGASYGTIQALDPLLVNFGIPEQELSRVNLGDKIDITVDAYPKQAFKGKITAINAVVDQTTRNITIQSTIPNPMKILYPGMFVNVTVILPKAQNVLVVPQTTIAYSLYGDTVYVVSKQKDKEGKTALIAKQRFVKLGEQRARSIVVTTGVKAGETVVTSGQLKLQNGSHVKVNNAVKLNKTIMTNG